MKETFSLKKNQDFRYVYNRGKSFGNRLLVIYYLPNGKDYNKLGISVSKKVGNSVVRHRVKRLIKEAYRLNEKNIKKGYNIIIIARIKTNEADFKTVEKALIHLIKKVKFWL